MIGNRIICLCDIYIDSHIIRFYTFSLVHGCSVSILFFYYFGHVALNVFYLNEHFGPVVEK